MSNNKQEALGGNFKVFDLKTFASKENLFNNRKKYRRVFDTTEACYIYCEVSFYNKLFDEQDWEADVNLICTDKKTGKEICNLNKKKTIEKSFNIAYIREGWGTPEPGWWKVGNYEWKVAVNGEAVGHASFYIVDHGLVTADNNPYFDINLVRLFESPKSGMTRDKRKYLQTFSAVTTRYVNIELELKNKLVGKTFPLEVIFNFYNDSGQLKAHLSYFRHIGANNPTISFDSGYGSMMPGYWYKDKYTIEVIFMDQIVAVVPFDVGETTQEQEGEATFTADWPKHLPVPLEEPKLTFEEAKKELDELIGLNAVKTQINELATYLRFLKIRTEKGIADSSKINLHAVFTGNPGTGKTTVARLLGKIYHSLDLLPHGKVHEVGRADLVGEYIGQTAPKVKKAIEAARGGILFVDEAYSLTDRGGDGKDFGREVIEVLLKELSDGKGDISIIFAGYPKEMQQFLDSNPGMASRLSNLISFPDYSPDELMEIAKYSARQRGVSFEEEAEKVVYKRIVDVYRERDDKFGNARYVNGIVEEAKQNMALRLMAEFPDPDKLESNLLSTIGIADVQKIFSVGTTRTVKIPVDEPLLADALQQLNELVGLNEVKKEVEEMAKLVRYYIEIGKDVKKAFSIHTVFTGNPGTGKTTIARLMVQIYKALGILERGHIVECDRKDLVASYVGQTAEKTGVLIDKAMGGGLFIDEAYALAQGGRNDFGREAIETILKRMEDQRGEFMVIVAGYPEEMRQFLEANPGLMSRFDKQFDFKDYTVEELYEIALNMFEQEGMMLEEDAATHLGQYIQTLYDTKHKYFGNARTVRKIIGEAVRRQHLRMASMSAAERTAAMISTVTLADMAEFKLVEERNERRAIGFGGKR